MAESKHINWTVSLFLTITPLVGIIGAVALALNHAVYWQTLCLALVFTLVTGFSITAGYHRLFAHKSYQASAIVRWFFIFFGSGAFEGSVLEWCTDHRNHHRYTDTERDPYNINAGFWYAHIGWLFHLDPNQRDFSNVKDLAADPVLRWQNHLFIPIAIISGFILPMLIAASWGDWLGGLIFAGCCRITVNQHVTFFINSICHFFGKKTYSEDISARDNWLTALFTYGEGYHNFHHQFPIDYRNAIRFYQYDPTKWLIRALAAVGLASQLKRVNPHRILQSRLTMDKKRLEQLSQSREEWVERFQQIIQPAYDYVLSACERLDQLERQYQQLKATRSQYVQGKLKRYRAKVKIMKAQMQQAKRELRGLMRVWSDLRALVPTPITI